MGGRGLVADSFFQRPVPRRARRLVATAAGVGPERDAGRARAPGPAGPADLGGMRIQP